MPRKSREPVNPLQNRVFAELVRVFPPQDGAAAAHPLVTAFNKLSPLRQAHAIILTGMGLGGRPTYIEINDEYGIPKGSIGPTKERVAEKLIKYALADGWDPGAVEKSVPAVSPDDVHAIEPSPDAPSYEKAS